MIKVEVREGNFEVNTNQFSCAVAALCDQRKRRQFVLVPAGKMPKPILIRDG